MLSPDDFMCVVLAPKAKNPIHKWSLPENHYTYEAIQCWTNQGYNYGILCGVKGLAVLDIDNISRCAELGIRPFCDTYTVRTGKGGLHLYYQMKDAKPLSFDDLTATTTNQDGKVVPVHLGELRWHGQFVVGAGCIHPNGNQYKIIDSSPVRDDITYEEIVGLFKGKTKYHIEGKTKSEVAYRSEAPFKVTDVWNISKGQQTGDNYLIKHPVHGSTGQGNVSINVSKNCWKCFRCNSGGGPELALAVDAGIIQCHEAGSGVLRGSKWTEVCREAARRGLI
jgi:Bifunctional DNA primase/polymerase, N-terminal